MARYNTSLASATITGATTISTPNSGTFTAFTGTAPYTVTLPSPAAFPGQNQTFYNATSGTVTLSSPTGIFTGTGGSGLTTTSVFTGNVVSVTSDGTNYIVISEDGSILTATTGSFSGDVTINGGSATVSITAGTVNIAPTQSSNINNIAIGSSTRASGAFTTLAANNAVVFTANTASSTTGTGTVVITGGVGVTGQVTATNLAGTLQTAAQPNITSVGTLGSLSITNGGTVNTRYLHYQLNQELGNDGVNQGYLLLAKAYISGNQAISYVKGYFTMTRGSTTSGNKSDIFYVNSQSAYQSDTLLVTGSTNGGFWSRTCKVTYNGVVYHAIETGAGGGSPDNGVFFTGEFTNCSPTFTDARSVSAVTAYGFYNLTAADGGTFFTNGAAIFNDSNTANAGGVKLYINGGTNGWPVTSGTAQTSGAFRIRGGDNAVLDFGVNGGNGAWLQVTDRSNLVVGNSYPLLLQPNGGSIGVGLGTSTPSYKLHVNGNTFTTGMTISTGGGVNVANTMTIDTTGSGMARYYSRGGDASTRGAHEWHLASSNGSIDNIGMTLSTVGNLSISGTLTESSSIALKENIEPITGALDLVNQLMGKIYDRRDNGTKQESGLIAEEVFVTAPNLVALDENGKPVGVKYTKIIAYLIESVKELSEEIRKLKGK